MFGWLKRRPDFHDTPCHDITLAGANFESPDAAHEMPEQRVITGAFVAFGTPTTKGQVIPGSVPCNGAVMKISPEGGKPDLVAWGFRNPFGLAFASDGKLYVTDNGYDERGSRPVWGAGDLLWAVTQGTWYGWPDFSGGLPLTRNEFRPPTKRAPQFLLASHPNPPPKPVASFGVHSSSNGIDFSRNAQFGYAGQAFVAQFGDMAPTAGKVLHPVGFKVVRVNVGNGLIEDFATNIGRTNGPASMLGKAGLERPVAVRFNPDGSALYIVDFGIMTVSENGAKPVKGTGVLWRVTKGGSR